MNKDVLKKLFEDPKFVDELLKKTDKEEIKKMLNDAGAEVTDEDLKTAEEKGKNLIEEIKTKLGSKKIAEKDLEKISGGYAKEKCQEIWIDSIY